MNTKITSQIIGELTPYESIKYWWKSNEIEIPFFDNKKLEIIFTEYEPEEDKKFIEEADNALTNFLKLTTDDRKSISELAHNFYLDFMDSVDFYYEDESIKEIKLDDIWNFIHPSEIYISRRSYKDKDIYVKVACDCDWDDEHGMQLIFRQGKKLTRISDQDGHLTEADAYAKPDEEDELLSKFY